MSIDQLSAALHVSPEVTLSLLALVVLLALVGVVYEVAGIVSDIMTAWTER